MKARARAAGEKLLTSIRGLSPEAVALIFAVGLVLGVFPMYGAPTLLCAAAAVAFRLNLPAIQLINQLTAPLQLALLAPLARAGEKILGEEGHRAAWNLATAARNAVVGWCCVCIPAGLALYCVLCVALRWRARATAEYAAS